jgi:uncharacterized repeat protein (TIGR01451 family)
MTLTATVLPLGDGIPTGTVRFLLEPSGIPLEAPVGDGGTAVVSTPAPRPGDHVVRVEYTGDDTHEPSAEEARFTTIDPGAPLATVTTVTVGGGPVPDAPVDVVADVTAPGSGVTPAGTCDVRQGEVLLATRVPVDLAGQCRYRTGSLPGSGDLVVTFVPVGPFLGSASDPVPVVSVGTAAAAEAGGLLLSTPFTSDPADFGTALLDPVAASWRSAMSLRADGGMGGIRIEDRRPGSNTFSLTLSVSPSPDLEPDETLPGSALSFRDTVARYVPGDRLDGLTPETTVETFDILGFGEVPQVAARGTGPGEVVVEGDLLVALPTSVAPGTYTTTIVFTLMGGDPPPPADLALDKTAVPAEGTALGPGDEVTWSLAVTNTGTTPVADVEVVDDIPRFVTLSDPGGAEASEDGGRLTWRVSLGPGESTTLEYAGVVVDEFPAGSQLVNVAAIPVAGVEDSTRHPLVVTDPTASSSTSTTLSSATSAPTTPTTTTDGSSVTSVGTSAGTSPVTQPPGTAPGGPGGPLARTGVEIAALVLAGVVAVALGVVVVLGARRRPGGSAGRRVL